MLDTSVIEISRSAYRHNLRFLRSRLGKQPVFSSVVKGNAYGHGLEVFVPMVEEVGVRHFSVFSAAEAYRVLRVRRHKETRVMIMGFVDRPELEWAIAKRLEFWVFDRPRLEAAVKAAKRVGRRARVHLEVETGLNRTGLSSRDLDFAVTFIQKNSAHIEVVGICTHYAGAESIGNYVRVHEQIERYLAICARLKQRKVALGQRHTACSAAALMYPETVMDLARIGIAQYGFWPSRETFVFHIAAHRRPTADPLKRLITWKSAVMSLKTVKAGEFVGYGMSYLPEKANRVAVVPVGYGCGYSRSLSNQGRVLIRGRRASVIGMVNMSIAMVNVTNVPGVSCGDEVVLIGRQKKHEITVGSFSDLTNTLNYELLARLPADIPRVVTK